MNTSPLRCFGGLGGQLGPNQHPVVRTEIAAGEFTLALVLDAGAVRNGNAGPTPPVDGLLRQVEPLGQARLEPGPVEKGLP